VQRGRFPTGFLVVILLCMAPAVAPAAGAAEIQLPNTSGVVYLGVVRGGDETYEVRLSVPNDHAVGLRVSGAKLRELPALRWTSYAVRPSQPLSSGSLVANFASVGHVSLHFEPEGKPKLGRLPEGCTGRRPRRQPGVYRGAISLHGENGYFEVERVAAKGIRTRSFQLLCRSGHAAHPATEQPLDRYVAPSLGGHDKGQADLETFAEIDGRRVGLEAWNYFGDFPAVAAGVFEALPSMAIGRYWYRAYPLAYETSGFDGGPLTFRTGGASFNTDAARPETWSGEVSIDFPGLSQPVLGPQFRTRLCIRERAGSAMQCVGEPQPVLPGGSLAPPP
jgi:hypothetical protein